MTEKVEPVKKELEVAQKVVEKLNKEAKLSNETTLLVSSQLKEAQKQLHDTNVTSQVVVDELVKAKQQLQDIATVVEVEKSAKAGNTIDYETGKMRTKNGSLLEVTTEHKQIKGIGLAPDYSDVVPADPAVFQVFARAQGGAGGGPQGKGSVGRVVL